MIAIPPIQSAAAQTKSPSIEVQRRTAASKHEASLDAELVRLSNAGDNGAFVEIMTRHRDRVFSLAFRHLHSHADAEEITQDTFIRAHRGLGRFRGDSSLATWLHRIAFNLSRNRCKHNFCRRQHSTLSLDCALNFGSQAAFSDLVATEAPGPVREAAASEFSELVVACMKRLGTSHREILTMRSGLSQSYSDIARALGVSVGTVKSRIGRARENLRELLAESYPGVAPGPSLLGWFDSIRSHGRIAIATA
jgi:RNA polymerase sigma-70 factor (ECF subfamily)